MKIELHGLEVFGHHGATEVEEREGQVFLVDLVLDLRSEPAADDLEQTIDYRDVAACVREVSERQRVQLLETLTASIADELDPPAEYSAVIVERP